MKIFKYYKCHTFILLILLISLINVISVLAGEVTVTLQNGVDVHGEVYQGAEDASIGTRTPHSAGISLESWYHHQRGLIRFDLSPIPSGKILSATLFIYVESYPGLHTDLKNQGKIEFRIHEIMQKNWDDNKANWDTYDGIDIWANPGGDFKPTPVSSFTMDTVGSFQDIWLTFDVTMLVQQYIDNGTEPNPGMLLKASNKLYPILSLVNSESPKASFRPKLEITYFSEAPIADAGVNHGVELGRSFKLDATKSYDPNELSKELTYSWHFASKPGGSNLIDGDIVPNNTTGMNGADTPTFIPDAEGDYEIELTVSNNSGLSDKDWVTISCLEIRPHPRIWLTPEILQALRNKAATNAPEWTAFKKVVDNYLANGSDPYSEATYIYTYALAYLITGDKKYADRALNIINENIYPFNLPNGSPDYWGPYFARNYAVYLAVGYDWLYNYLSKDDKIRFYNKMNEWAGYYFYGDPPGDGNYTWALNEPNNNFFYGRIVGGGLTGIATFGDNPRAKEWLDLVRYEKYEKIAKPQLLTDYNEGAWLHEGSGYSDASYLFLLQYFSALKTATGEDLFRDTDFPQVLIHYIIYDTQPTLDRHLPTGTWGDSVGRLNYYIRAILLNLASEFKGLDSAEYALWYINHVNFENIPSYYKWMDLMWYDATMPERNISELPLYYFAPGIGHIFARSDWGANATWIAFQCGGDEVYHDHEHLSQGSFFIYKNGWLAAPANVAVGGDAGSSSLNYNTIIINNGTKDIGQHSWPTAKAVIEKFEPHVNYLYVSGELRDRYNSSRGKVYVLDYYNRNIVFLSPDYVIICDRIKTSDPKYHSQWHLKTVNEPNIARDLMTITKDQGKMLIKILEPSGFIINKYLSAGWSTRIVPELKQQEQIFLNAFYMADINDNTISQIDRIAEDNIVGAQISNKVAIFSKTKSLMEKLHYTVDGQGVIENFIFDMVPNRSYPIYLDTNLIQNVTSNNNGVLTFNLELIGSHLISIGEPSYNLGKPGKPIHVDR